MRNAIYRRQAKHDSESRIEGVLAQQLLPAFNQTLSDLHPSRLITDYLRNKDLHGDLAVFAFGKASGLMAQGFLEGVSGANSIRGVVTSTVLPKHLGPLKVFSGGHPIPNEDSLRAGRAVVECASSLKAHEHAVCLISGGGSALLEDLAPGVSLDMHSEFTQALIGLGMEDHELNTFRKLLSTIKGGKLARLIHPASILNLMISDVAGNDVEAIASGPTVACTTTVAQMHALMEKWKLKDRLAPAHHELLASQLQSFNGRERAERYPSIETEILLDNRWFLRTLAGFLEASKGFTRVFVFEEELRANPVTCAKSLAKFITDKVTEHGDESLCILGRGEIPVEVKADGKGGRNQHFALLVGCQLNHLSNWAFASLASDGCDYLKGIAGGYVTGQVLAEATALGGSVEQCIADTDSYAFHRRHQTHLYCDEGTGMNVSDIYVFVKMAGSTG